MKDQLTIRVGGEKETVFEYNLSRQWGRINNAVSPRDLSSTTPYQLILAKLGN
jgi:hypothetical protein